MPGEDVPGCEQQARSSGAPLLPQLLCSGEAGMAKGGEHGALRHTLQGYWCVCRVTKGQGAQGAVAVQAAVCTVSFLLACCCCNCVPAEVIAALPLLGS